MNFSMTAQPQNKAIIDLQSLDEDNTFNMSAKDSLMNTNKNPMMSPGTTAHAGGFGDAQKRHMTEQDPF